MIRRQVYLEPSHQRKLSRLAARWGCTESEVLRAAVERLAESEDPIDTRLIAAGLPVPSPPERDLPRGSRTLASRKPSSRIGGNSGHRLRHVGPDSPLRPA